MCAIFYSTPLNSDPPVGNEVHAHFLETKEKYTDEKGDAVPAIAAPVATAALAAPAGGGKANVAPAQAPVDSGEPTSMPPASFSF